MNEQETLQDRFNAFQAEVRKLQQKPKSIDRELSEKQGKLARLTAARSSQLALEETAKAKILAQEIEKLQEEIEILQAKAAAFGPGGRQSAQALVQNAPDSQLYNLAISIVEEAASVAPGLEAELMEFVNYGAEEEKQRYIAKIEGFSNKLSELWAISFAGMTVEKFLPDHLRQCKKPRLIAPMQSLFEIGIMEVGEVYKPLSRTSLPD